MTPQELNDGIVSRGYNQSTFAKLIGVSRMSIVFWIHGQRKISQAMQQYIQMVFDKLDKQSKRRRTKDQATQ